MNDKLKYFLPIIITVLVAAGGFYYFKYYQKASVETSGTFSEEILDKMGRPEKYFYISGKISSIDVQNKKIGVEIESVADFEGEDFSSDWRGLVRNFVAGDDTKIQIIDSSIKVDSENLSSSDINEAVSKIVTQADFSRLKKGDSVNISVLMEETKKDDNWKTTVVSLEK